MVNGVINILNIYLNYRHSFTRKTKGINTGGEQCIVFIIILYNKADLSCNNCNTTDIQCDLTGFVLQMRICLLNRKFRVY